MSTAFALVDHIYSTWTLTDHGNGHDIFQVNTGSNNSANRLQGTIYRVLIENYRSDENCSWKCSDIKMWYCTVRTGGVYVSANRHGRRMEMRSCYLRKPVRSYGEGHRFIGCAFNGSGARLLLGAGDSTQDQFEGSTLSYPASEGALIAGCTFLGGAGVTAGFDNGFAGLDTNAFGATAEGNIKLVGHAPYVHRRADQCANHG